LAVQAARKDIAMARRSSLFRHILVPHDFSEQATVALTTAGRLAKAHGGKLSVLYVLEPFCPPPADVPFMPTLGDLVPKQKRLLEQLVTKTLGRRRPQCTVRVEIGEAAQHIINAGRGVDSIVMATSGRTGIAHFLVGSVAERVVRHATVPVLTLRVPIKKRRRPRK
jgi:nucleotide-binding universal stress UspA family protein